MFSSFFQYLCLAPSFTNVLNVYAFCNLHDVCFLLYTPVTLLMIIFRFLGVPKEVTRLRLCPRSPPRRLRMLMHPSSWILLRSKRMLMQRSRRLSLGPLPRLKPKKFQRNRLWMIKTKLSEHVSWPCGCFLTLLWPLLLRISMACQIKIVLRMKPIWCRNKILTSVLFCTRHLPLQRCVSLGYVVSNFVSSSSTDFTSVFVVLILLLQAQFIQMVPQELDGHSSVFMTHLSGTCFLS